MMSHFVIAFSAWVFSSLSSDYYRALGLPWADVPTPFLPWPPNVLWGKQGVQLV